MALTDHDHSNDDLQSAVDRYVLTSYQWPASQTTITYSFAEYSYPGDGARNDMFGSSIANADRAIVREAMAAWERVCDVRFVEVPDSIYANVRIGWQHSNIGNSANNSDGVGGTLGIAYTWYIGSTIIEQAIVFDPADNETVTEFYDTALHELGHVLGISHSNVPYTVMAGPPYTNYAQFLGKNQLTADDIAAARAIWGGSGDPGPAPPEPEPEPEPEDRFTGTHGDDFLSGTDGDDRLYGRGGDDRIYGGDGDDVVAGQAGFDTLSGGDGNDTMKGGGGDDDLFGSYGDDRLIGGNGDDTLNGSFGDDRLNGGNGEDDLDGSIGDDLLEGGRGADSLYGSTGDDTLKGQGGSDTLDGGLGDDTLVGGGGNDKLDGWSGDDSLKGGGGNDVMDGGSGSDTLTGGRGNDTMSGDDFTFSFDRDVFVFARRHGHDEIKRFSDDRDILDLSRLNIESFDDIRATQIGDGVRINLTEHGGGTILLKGFNLADLDAYDFVL